MKFTKVAIDKMADALDALGDPSVLYSIDPQAANIIGAPLPPKGPYDDVIQDFGNRAFEAGKKGISDASNAANDFIQKEFGPSVGSKVEGLGASASDIAKSITGRASDAANAIAGHASDLFNSISGHASEAKDALMSLIHEHPEKVLAAAGGGGAAVGGAGLLAARHAKNNAAKETSTLLSKLKSSAGANKKLALLAALGIPASAAAAYFASTKKGR